MPGGRPKQFDQGQALQSAMELFWQRGYEAASLPELLEAMGVSRQSLYDTFGSKRGLFLSAIEHYRDTQLAQGLSLLQRPGSPLANVRSLVQFFRDLAADPRCRGCLVANTLVELGPHDPEIATILRETLESLRQAVESALDDAQARGELPPAKSPRGLSRALTNAMVGLAVSGKLPIGAGELAEIYAGTLSMLD